MTDGSAQAPAPRPSSLLITFDYPPIVGGIAHVLGRFWRLAGHEGCTIMAPSTDGDVAYDEAHPIKTLRFAARGSGAVGKVLAFVAASWKAAWWLLHNRPDFVIAGQLVRAGPICYLWHRLTGRPFDLWVYGGETAPHFTGSAWMTRRLHRILRRARHVFTNSPFTTQEMLDFGLGDDRVVEVPLGVDRDTFHPAAPSREFLERFDLQDKLVLLTVGRLVQRKGVDAALHALHALGDRLPPWRYVIVSDGPYRPQLEELTAQLGLAHRVVFTGYVEEDDLPRLYNACDIFLMPNRQVAETTDSSLSVEGFGIVFLEAAACGKPVIAGRSGGAVHAVADGVSGILVDTDSPELEQALMQLADAGRRRQMGTAGLEFSARFTWERSAEVLRQYL